MHIERYLDEVADAGSVSEIALYTPLTTHILRGLLKYPASSCLINQKKEKGIPDVRILSTADRSEWMVCEAKLKDHDIRSEASRTRIWHEQIVAQQYITAETVYILMCAPHTFRVYDVQAQLVAGADLVPDQHRFHDSITGENLPLTDESLRRVLEVISADASQTLPQYERFRNGELAGGYIPLSQATVKQLLPVFEFGLRELKTYCKASFEALQEQYEAAQTELAQVAEQLIASGTESQLRSDVRNRARAIRRKYRTALQLFDLDYPQFQHDQAYAGTEKEEHFQDIFVTNTAYIALTRLFFVRICEDIDLTTRKISNEGPGVWARFVTHIKHEYQDLLTVAYRDASSVYSRLFEATVFDWYGAGNGKLNAILEQILLRLNAFSFAAVDRDLLGTVYQYFRPRAERKRLGEYYTPVEVVDYILARSGMASDADLMAKRVLDPSCGSFTFGARAIQLLLRAGQHLTARNKIQLIQKTLVGRDINPFSVFLSHLSLLFTILDIYHAAKQEDPAFMLRGFDVANVNSLLSESGQRTLIGDATQRVEGGNDQGFDYVVGNPPFVRNERVPEEDRAPLQEAFKYLRSGNTDLATYFLDSALRSWLKDEGILGMVAPIGQSNAKNAALLRTRLAGYTIFEIVSLEWMAKEIFPDADILPILLFIKKSAPAPDHKIAIVTGLQTKIELAKAGSDAAFRETHVSEIDYTDWLNISPTGDWPLDVTARDMPILQKLSAAPRLETAATAHFGIKLGSNAASIASLRDTRRQSQETLAFAKGQHLCAFGISTPEEVLDMQQIRKASDASLWGDLSFYQANRGRRNETGLNGTTFASNSLLTEALPSDTLCCLVPEIYTTLAASVADPLQVCANNSVVVAIPYQCSAHVLAAVINSRISRYYAFLTMRAAILLRRRAHWYPRTLLNLPWPSLDATAALQLHHLAQEAAALSEQAQRTEIGVYLERMEQITERRNAGFLGIYLVGEGTVDRDDLTAASPTGSVLALGSCSLHAPDADTLLLARLAALVSDEEEFDNHGLQNLSLPARSEDRKRLADALRALEGLLEGAKSRMEAITEESDSLIGSALGLTAAEQAVIRGRCAEFPLSVTVGRPRYVWNSDRKTQARRVYEEGQRFR